MEPTTPDELIDYLIGVYKTLVTIHFPDDKGTSLHEAANTIISTLAPYVAYRLATKAETT